MEALQLLVGGIANGCVYGLIALGFVLIYKATEQVNFAQGDLMMLGAFFGLMFIADFGMPWWQGAILAIVFMAVLGFLLEVVALRPIMGQPQFAVVILTIALGFVFRSVAGAIWGHDPQGFQTPYSGGVTQVGDPATGQVTIGHESVAVVLGTVVLVGLLYVFFRYTRMGIAMQASSQNQLAAYYMGIPVKRVFSLIWAISAGVAAVAGLLLAPMQLVDPDMGFTGIKAFAAAVVGGFGSLPGAMIGGLLIGIVEPFAQVYIPMDVSTGIGPVDWAFAQLDELLQVIGMTTTSAYWLMLVVLVVRPQGLFAQIQRKKV